MKSSWVPALFWFFVATLVRLGVFLLTHFYSLEIGFEGFYPLASGHDDRFYFEKAAEVAQGYAVDVLPNIYPLVLGYFFSWFGIDLFLGKILNVFVGALSVIPGVLLAEKLKPWWGDPWALRRPGHLAGVLLAFYPSSVFYSTQLLKDPLVLLLGMWLLYTFATLRQRFRLSSIFLSVAISSFLSLLRPYAMVALWLAWGIHLLLQRKGVRLLLVGGILFGVVPWFLGLGPFALNYLTPILDPEQLSEFRQEAYGGGGSSLGISLDLDNPLIFLIVWFYSAITVFLGPFPWQVNTLLTALAMGEAAVVWLLMWKARFSLRRLLRPSWEELPLFAALVLSGAIGLFSDNLGANTRLRLLAWSFLFVYVAIRIGGKSAPSLPHHPR